MALIKCPKCGQKIPEHSKFCNECGCPIPERKESIHIAITNEDPRCIVDDNQKVEDIDRPRLSMAFWICGIIIPFCCWYLQTVVTFFMILILAVCVLVCFGSMYVFISDYRLYKKDFEQYRIKAEENERREETLEKMRQQLEMDKQRQQKEIKEKRIENSKHGIPSCPKCGSTSIATINRGYSIVWGFLGSGAPMNVCQACGHKFKPGT